MHCCLGVRIVLHNLDQVIDYMIIGMNVCDVQLKRNSNPLYCRGSFPMLTTEFPSVNQSITQHKSLCLNCLPIELMTQH